MVRIIIGVLFIIAAAVLTTLNARAVDMSKAPVKYQTIVDPVSAGCKNPQVDTEKSGVFALDDGRFGILVIFKCDKET